MEGELVNDGCPACGRELAPCRYCGRTSYFMRSGEPVQVHSASCVRTPVARFLEDVGALAGGGLDDETARLLAARAVARLRNLIALWPRDRLGDVPRDWIAFGERCEGVLARGLH